MKILKTIEFWVGLFIIWLTILSYLYFKLKEKVIEHHIINYENNVYNIETQNQNKKDIIILNKKIKKLKKEISQLRTDAVGMANTNLELLDEKILSNNKFIFKVIENLASVIDDNKLVSIISLRCLGVGQEELEKRMDLVENKLLDVIIEIGGFGITDAPPPPLDAPPAPEVSTYELLKSCRPPTNDMSPLPQIILKTENGKIIEPIHNSLPPNELKEAQQRLDVISDKRASLCIGCGNYLTPQNHYGNCYCYNEKCKYFEHLTDSLGNLLPYNWDNKPITVSHNDFIQPLQPQTLPKSINKKEKSLLKFPIKEKRNDGERRLQNRYRCACSK